ncbi:MAG TPA: dTDP-4-dehydrorhamnose 3,5-epimerase [Microbacteriaceae bacterium]|nr:dTDP-4-dehydrorhamnose 3,5-epimerase [Microbacteriaceae bacterium]
MTPRELSITGAWEVNPTVFRDERGGFLEAYRAETLGDAIGHRFQLAQMNVSISARGVVRGIHYADVPPGQAKYVQCFRGAIIDFVVDIRVGSPTFGKWEAVRLDDENRSALYISEGLGHAFVALEDDTTVGYLVSETYNAPREHGISPLDPAIGLEFPFALEDLVLSAKDRDAPSLAEVLDAGTLPVHTDVLAYLRQLADR